MDGKEIKVSFGTLSERGERKVNEDFLGTAKRGSDSLFILCDGLGGHGKGDEASKCVVESLKEIYENSDFSLEDCIEYAQKKLIEAQEAENAGNGMKTTLVCLEISGDRARFLHVGDSRGYYFRKGKYKVRTLDHSVPQMLVNMGQIKEKEIRHHEDRSRLLKVMGTPWDTPKYQTGEDIKVDDQTTFLLCSDGFWELIEEKEMEQFLKRSDTPQEWLEKMAETVVKNGIGTGMDNYSAVAVFARS